MNNPKDIIALLHGVLATEKLAAETANTRDSLNAQLASLREEAGRKERLAIKAVEAHCKAHKLDSALPVVRLTQNSVVVVNPSSGQMHHLQITIDFEDYE